MQPLITLSSNTSQQFPTLPDTAPNRPTLPNRSQITCTTYHYNNDIPKFVWHIGTKVQY
jgi:hypothetical protein